MFFDFTINFLWSLLEWNVWVRPFDLETPCEKQVLRNQGVSSVKTSWRNSIYLGWQQKENPRFVSQYFSFKRLKRLQKLMLCSHSLETSAIEQKKWEGSKAVWNFSQFGSPHSLGMQTVKPEHGDGVNAVEQNPIPVKTIYHVAPVTPMLSWVGIKKNIMVNKLLTCL